MSFLPKVAILVLNYNGNDCLLACLRSLATLSYPNTDIIIVDNGSEDGSLEQARQAFPDYTYLTNQTNLGFAAGMNIGIRTALDRQAEWCWLFNYDATTETETLSTLMRAALHHPEAGLLSPLITETETEALWFGKGRVNALRMRTEHVTPSLQELSQETYPSVFLTGCALLMRRACLEKIGLLDEQFFLYYEDADLCLRTTAAGFQTLVVPAARVRHSEKSRSNPRKLYYLVLSGLLFFRKHASAPSRTYFALYVTIRRIKNSIDTLLGRENAALVRKAYADGTKSSFLFPDFR